MHQNHLKGSLKHRLLGLLPLEGLGRSQEFTLLPSLGNADAAHTGTTLSGNHCFLLCQGSCFPAGQNPHTSILFPKREKSRWYSKAK